MVYDDNIENFLYFMKNANLEFYEKIEESCCGKLKHHKFPVWKDPNEIKKPSYSKALLQNGRPITHSLYAIEKHSWIIYKFSTFTTSCYPDIFY